MRRYLYNLPLRAAAWLCDSIARLYLWLWEDGDKYDQDNELAYEHQKIIWEARHAAKEIRKLMKR
jgi:hypothetical protein